MTRYTNHFLVSEIKREVEGGNNVQLISGFGGSVGRLSLEGGFSSDSSSGDGNQVLKGENLDKLMGRTINATIVLVAGTFSITKFLTIDYDYWHILEHSYPQIFSTKSVVRDECEQRLRLDLLYSIDSYTKLCAF
ncbi:unnamed protein product [Lactuca virosa]|uniref:Uncharacterized protein n=1 Tax=Lactuca virosa TaxID=75947 RepID=A0AAU9LRN6_9ASTR|nr:unnamed protein product [Lactuca virosa]